MSRAPLIASAVSFLRDPSAASSPLAQRIAFLESKGLTPQEVESALAQASGGGGGGIGPGAPTYGGQMRMAGQRREFERDWRDWFIMGVVGGTVGYVAVKLAQKFIVPHLQPPSETDLEAAQKALESKYDEAADLLKTLQLSTDTLAASFDEQKADIEKELVEVRKAVEEMREGEKQREEWSRKIGEQVDEVVRSLPNLLDKQAQSHTQSLTDLQTELKSLKSLLIARRPATPAPASPVTTPAVTPHPNTPAPGNNVIPPPPSSSPSSSSLLGARKPGIPAWQMRGTGAALSGSSTPVTGSTFTTTAPAYPAVQPYAVPDTTSAPVAQEDPSASGVLVEREDAGATEGTEKKVEGSVSE